MKRLAVRTWWAALGSAAVVVAPLSGPQAMAGAPWVWSARAVSRAWVVEGVPSARLWYPQALAPAAATIVHLLHGARPVQVSVPTLRHPLVFMDWIGPNMLMLTLRGVRGSITILPVWYLEKSGGGYRAVEVSPDLWYKADGATRTIRDPALYAWLMGSGWRHLFTRETP